MPATERASPLLLLLCCWRFASDRDDDVVHGALVVGSRTIEAHDHCPRRSGTGGDTWSFALSDPAWAVREVGLRASPQGPYKGVYMAEKGEFPQGGVNDFAFVEIGTEPCVTLASTGRGQGSVTFDCEGEPQGVEYPGGPSRLVVRGTLTFTGCPFP